MVAHQEDCLGGDRVLKYNGSEQGENVGNSTAELAPERAISTGCRSARSITTNLMS